MDNLEGKQSPRDVVGGVTQETARDAHDWIPVCRNSIPKGLHPPGRAYCDTPYCRISIPKGSHPLGPRDCPCVTPAVEDDLGSKWKPVRH